MPIFTKKKKGHTQSKYFIYDHLKYPTNIWQVNFEKSRATKCTIKTWVKDISPKGWGEPTMNVQKFIVEKKKTLRKSPSETSPNHCIGENLSETLGPGVKL